MAGSREDHRRLEMLARIPEENPNPVLRVTPEGTVLYANAAAKAVSSLFHPASTAQLSLELGLAVNRYCKDNGPGEVELDLRGCFWLFRLSRSGDGRAVNLFGTDISRRREAEAALNRHQQTLESIIDALPAVVNVKDRDHRFVLVNPMQAHFYGLEPGDMLGKRIEEIADAEYSAKTYARDQKVLSTGQPLYHYEDEGIDANGNLTSWHSAKVPLRNPFGEVEGVLTVAQDISARQAMENELVAAKEMAEAATEAKSRFLGHMSHELRTPLNAIIGMTEMLYDEAQDDQDPEVLEPLERITRAGRHLLALIEALLDLTRIEAGRLELNQRDLAVRVVVEDVAVTARTLAQKHANEFELNLVNELGIVHTDPARLRQILLNLLGNACKFTRAGKVSLTAERLHLQGREWLVFAVEDTGIGISEADLPKLFDEFSQLRKGPPDPNAGAGLGLAISQRLCQAMGGEIEVRSEVGAGSQFRFRIPV